MQRARKFYRLERRYMRRVASLTYEVIQATESTGWVVRMDVDEICARGERGLTTGEWGVVLDFVRRESRVGLLRDKVERIEEEIRNL